VEQLEGGPGIDQQRVAGVAAGPHEGPVAEGGTQPLPPGEDELGQDVEGRHQLRVDGPPPGPLGVEQGLQPLLDRLGDRQEARRHGHTGRAYDGPPP
jgi:hypothetical protein